MNGRPLIAHVLYRLDTGGMERIIVSLINATRDRYRHAVICLAGFGTMRDEIEDSSVPCLSLGKQPGKDWGCYLRMWQTLRRLKPDVVQTYNFGALDAAPIAGLAGVRHVVHAEHGRDASDPAGKNPKHLRLRRWMAPFLARHVAVSPELHSWLTDRVGIRPNQVAFIPNGIDTAAFNVIRVWPRPRKLLADFAPAGSVLVGNIARLDKVKDQASLISAFKLLHDEAGQHDCRLIIAGDGPQRAELERQIIALGLTKTVRLLGNRNDVAELLSECDVFALSSIAEGMPVTLLEAMGAGLPVVATDVGGVASVVENGTTGVLVPPGDPHALAKALNIYRADDQLRRRHGDAGRARVVEHFSLDAMVSAYVALYDELMARRSRVAHSKPMCELAERREH